MEPSRIDRWLETILSEALGRDGANLPGTHTSVSKAFLAYESRQVELQMYPFSTSVLSTAATGSDPITGKIYSARRDWSSVPCFLLFHLAL
jgi:hypothetical protein